MRVFVLIILAGFLGACMTTEPIVSKASVEKVEQGKEYLDYAARYALPRTVVNIKVVAEKKITKPGPFAAYAERYLGIAKVPTRETNEWSIKSVDITTTGEKDPDQIYRISSEGASRADRIQLDPEGVLLGVNLSPETVLRPGVQDIFVNQKGDLVIPGYSDLTLRKNTEPMLDTSYQTVRTDTSFMRLPVLKEQISTKTLMNQAEEAANVIMTLRERKYWLSNGEFVIEEGLVPLPDGPGLEIMMKEMSKLEFDYVSLFIGRTMTETKVYEYSYIPGDQSMRENVDLFTFSTFSGVLAAGNSNGEPVKLIVDPISGFTGPSDNVSMGNEDNNSNGMGLAYRIPGKANISVSMSGESLGMATLPIAQYGIIQFLPGQLLSKPDIMIRMHPELGSLEGIYEK